MKSKFWAHSLLSRLGKHASRPRLLARLLRDEDGSYLLYMVFAFPILIGTAGLAAEGGLVFYNHRTLQSAADSAAYSAAIAYSNNSSADITTQAQAIVANYGFNLGTGTNQASVSANQVTFAGQSAITVSISRPQSAFFSSIYFPTFPVAVSATAIISGNPGGSGTCLLALGNTATGPNAADSIHVQGSANLNMGGCGVFSNSTQCTSGDAVTIQGAGSLLAGSFGTAGCASGNGVHPANIGPPPNSFTQHDGPLSNPYAATTIPTTSSAGSCTPTATINSSGRVTKDGTLCPGVYSNGIDAKGSTVTLQPGIYILDGSFNVGPGGGTVTSAPGGVTLAFASSSGGMSIASNANVALTAPTSGPTAGFVLMGDSTMPLNTSFSVSANANADFNGTIYLPNGSMTWQGTADSAIGCRQFIVNTISLQGNPNLSSSGCGPSGGGSNGAGAPIGSTVTLVD